MCVCVCVCMYVCVFICVHTKEGVGGEGGGDVFFPPLCVECFDPDLVVVSNARGPPATIVTTRITLV